MMLKINSDLFLDDKKISEVEEELNTKIQVVVDANDIINSLIGISNSKKTINYA